MKNAVFTLAAILVSSIGLAQTTTENYVKTTTYKVETQDGSVGTDEKIEQVNYFDGLGRAKQSIAVKAGGNQEDVVSHFEYDSLGRQIKEYPPYATTTSGSKGFVANPLPDLEAFYNTTKYENTLNPFSETRFEDSPLNRVLEQGALGADWAINYHSDNDHTIKFGYQTNVANEVLNFDVAFPDGNTENPDFVLADSYYASNQLYKTITKDENWRTYDGKDRTTEEFKDKQGRVLLKRTYNNQQSHDTHYVYDDYGNLTYVLPPLASKKAKFYEVGMANYPSSTFVTGGNPTGSVSFGIEKTGVNTYQFVADFDLHNLENSTFRTGELMDMSLDSSLGNHVWLGSISMFESIPSGGYRYKYISYSVTNGKLMCYAGDYNSAGGSSDDLVIADFDQNRTINLPDTLEGLTEAETQANVQKALDNLCYQYKYDYRNRLVEKKIPGKGWEFIVYNKLDQPVLTQDANLNSDSKWLFTKYDAFGRVAYTGKSLANYDRAYTQQNIDQFVSAHYEVKLPDQPTQISNVDVYYTNDVYFGGDIESVYTINYYDDYNFDMDGIYPPTNAFGVPISDSTKSLPTGSKVRVLGTDDWITTVNYYDDKGRAIYIVSKNDYLETIDYTLNQYDFIGNVTKTETIHTKTGNAQINVQNEYTYDHVNRLIKDEQRTNLLEFTDLNDIRVEGNTLIREDGDHENWYSGFASSGKLIADGHVSWSTSNFDSKVVLGLSETNPNQSGWSDMQYAIYVYGGKINVHESESTAQYNLPFRGGSWNNGLYSEEDVLSIKRVNGVISYWKNDDLLYTSVTTNTNPLLIEGCLRKPNTYISNIQLYNDHQELIAKNTYDELGQLVKKDVGNTETNPLEEIDYTYNIRGWLKSVNNPHNGELGDDLFSYELSYNDQGIRLYNGNISQVIWKTASDHTQRKYNYYYDDLNRLRNGYFYEWSKNSRFNVYLNYDMNGNILSLNRRGAIVDNPDYNDNGHYGIMDNLAYQYDGNQLLKVTDSGNDNHGFKDVDTTDDDYLYDANENMTKDLNKNITNIAYNHLNLPTNILSGTGQNADFIKYTYAADGTKLQKHVKSGSPNGIINPNTYTTYAGNYIYENNNLKFFSQPEGYVEPDGNGAYNYVYQHKDHLGNIRLSYIQNTDTEEEVVFSDGFESTSGWDGSGNSWGSPISAFDSTFKRTGSHSGRLDENQTNNTSTVVHSNDWIQIDISEPTYYTVSAWVFLEDIDNNFAGVHLFMKTNEETGYATEVNTTDTQVLGQWYKLEKSILVPEHIDKLNIRIDNRRNGKVWFDDVKITKGNAANTIIVEENNYYPFGLKHKGYNNVINGTDHPYGFGGKEEQDELGLGWMDVSARNYDPALGRWMNLDPLAEQMRRHSPYNFGFNNPIYFQDYDGMAPSGPCGDKPCPELPSGIDIGPLKGIKPFMPSQETSDLMNLAGELFSEVFDGDIDIEAKAKYGGKAEVQVGPGTLGIDVNLVSMEVEKLDENGLTLTGKALDVSLEAGIGKKEGNGPRANAEYTLAEGNVIIDKNLDVSTDGKMHERDFNATMGNKDFEVKASNSMTLGAKLKVGPVKLAGSADVYKATVGTATLLKVATSYVSDIYQNIFGN